MTITINKQDVYDGVMILTAVIGRNRQAMQAIAVMPENVPLLDTFIDEAVTEAENELHRHLNDSTDITLEHGAEAVSLHLDDKLRHARSTNGQIKSSLLQYLVHYGTGRWLASIEAAQDLSQPYENSAAGYVSKLQSLVCQRSPYFVNEEEYAMREKDDEAVSPTSPNDEYTTRENDSRSVNPTNKGAAKKLYGTRRRDIQPICRHIPDGVMLSEDEAIPADERNNILVAKQTEEDYGD